LGVFIKAETDFAVREVPSFPKVTILNQYNKMVRLPYHSAFPLSFVHHLLISGCITLSVLPVYDLLGTVGFRTVYVSLSDT
jgi:hypothetical protein